MNNTIYGSTTATPTPLVITDQNYNPDSQNPQSGIAVAEAIEGLGNSWEKIVDITIEDEESRGIMATVEEFPDIANCKEFIVRVIFPASPTGENLALGSARLDFNTSGQIMFRFSSTTVMKGAVSEHRCHCLITDDLIYSTGTSELTSQSGVTGGMRILVGNWQAPKIINNIFYYLNDDTNTKFLPNGTQLIIYGKKIEIGESAEEIIGDIETLLGGI